MTQSRPISNKALAAIALTAALACTNTSILAASEEPDHSAHQHDASTAAQPPADGDAKAPAQAMQKQMHAMKAIREKMMNAKTPEERSALRAEHMQTMQDGMGMMQKMGRSGDMGGMRGMGAPKGDKAMACDMHQSHRMMEMRMEMMQSMMEMMMDRMQSQTPMPPAGK